MKNLENIQKLIERADRLIRLETTGTPNEFAAKLGISRASLFRLLEELKNIEVPVKYCYKYKTYYYEYPVKIQFSYQVLKLDEENKE
jgi:DNA-binding transcriptional regulator LsrR (DeoR family)